MVGNIQIQRADGPGQRSITTRPDVTVGHILTQARLHNGLSIEAIAAILKIPVKQLKGLEAGELTVFPAEIYARGAFSKYADFLGVRAQETQRAFLRVLSGAREYVPLRVHRRKSWIAAQFTPRWIIAGVIASIALVVGSYVAWQVASFVWLPELAVVEPQSGVFRDTSVVVSGTANVEEVVKVNGEQVLLDKAGVWGANVGLHPGINVIQVEATNAAGRVRRVQKTVLLPR
jgi:TATA-box binding protein (TBP) (component of TFIID and TFIIIB)